jgi:hypothetical protein
MTDRPKLIGGLIAWIESLAPQQAKQDRILCRQFDLPICPVNRRAMTSDQGHAQENMRQAEAFWRLSTALWRWTLRNIGFWEYFPGHRWILLSSLADATRSDPSAHVPGFWQNGWVPEDKTSVPGLPTSAQLICSSQNLKWTKRRFRQRAAALREKFCFDRRDTLLYNRGAKINRYRRFWVKMQHSLTSMTTSHRLKLPPQLPPPHPIKTSESRCGWLHRAGRCMFDSDRTDWCRAISSR